VALRETALRNWKEAALKKKICLSYAAGRTSYFLLAAREQF